MSTQVDPNEPFAPGRAGRKPIGLSPVLTTALVVAVLSGCVSGADGAEKVEDPRRHFAADGSVDGKSWRDADSDGDGELGEPPVASGVPTTVVFDLKGFDAVVADGPVKLDLAQDDIHSVEVTIDDNLVDYLEVTATGKTLAVGLKPHYLYRGVRLNAVVTMPSLSGLVLSGAVSADVNFPSTGDLTVELSGGSSATFEAGAGHDLSAQLSGASQLQMETFSTVDAHAVISGSSLAALRAEGALTGEVTGASSLTYSGDPTSVGVTTSGAASVTAK